MQDIIMHSGKLSLGLIVCFLLAVVYQPQAHAQYQHERVRNAFSSANSQAYGGKIDLGGLGFRRGIASSESVGTDRDGLAHSESIALNRGLSVGNLDIDSSFKSTRTENNGHVSRNVAHNLNVGSMGLETSLSRQNLRKPLGLYVDDDGAMHFNLGLLNWGFGLNKRNKITGAHANAIAIADGPNGRTNSYAQTNENKLGLGLVSITGSAANSKGSAISDFGSAEVRTIAQIGSRKRRDSNVNSPQASQKLGIFRQKISSKLNLASVVEPTDFVVSNQVKTSKETNLANNSNVDVFQHFDENHKKERTFSFITSFISNLFNSASCVSPCTLTAYQQNQCCPAETVPTPTLPPNTNNYCSTCNSPAYRPNNFPQLPNLLPQFPQNGFYNLQFPRPYSCCGNCAHYTYYGPPPCYY